MMVEALPWLAAALGGGGRVLVHCRQGKSRSAAVVAAHLLRSTPTPPEPTASAAAASTYRYSLRSAAWAEAGPGAAALEEVLQRMRHARPIVAPNAGFMGQLRDRPWDRGG